MDWTSLEVWSVVLGVAGLLATMVLGITLHFLGVRTKVQQKKAISQATMSGKTAARTEMQRSQTLVDYGAREDAYLLVGKRCDTIAFLVVDDSDNTCKLVYGGSKENQKLNRLLKALKEREIKKVHKPYTTDLGDEES